MTGKRILWPAAMLAGALFAMSCAVRPMPGYEKDPSLAQVSGTLKVPGLQGEVKVYRDHWGVPHIFTENEHDLFFADGFVQAQDRLWQIMLFRALATGRLAELLGDAGIPGTKVMGIEVSAVAMDRRQRIMGMKYLGEVGEVLLKETEPGILAQLQAYCDGINAYVERNRDRLPLEFQVLYYQPDPFKPADVISLSRFEASMLTANLDLELLRYSLIKKYGEDKAWKLVPLHETLGPTVVPKEMLKNRLREPRPLPPGGRPDPSLTGLSPSAAMLLARTDKALRAASLFPMDHASNNWVVGPKLTADGAAMLANDPHLVHIEPSLSYLMHLKGAGYDAYGAVFPGQPFVVMGHTRRLSWGATVTFADTQDLFVETVDAAHPGQYLYKGEWRDFIVRKEVIRIRPGLVQTGPDRRFKEKEITIRYSIHGPIINDMAPDLPKDAPPLALRWVSWDFSRDPKVFETFITCPDIECGIRKLRGMQTKEIKVLNEASMFSILMRGQGVGDFVKAMEQNVSLNMNWVAADADGHIAYLPGGLVPIRKKGLGLLPAPGEKGEYDWTGFIPLMETPNAFDPPRGYMASANNQVVEAEWYPFVFGLNYDPGWRAWRIEELIQKYKPLTVEKMRLIQNDVHVKQAEVFVPLILKAAAKKKVADQRMLEAVKILREWDLEATVDSPGMSIFTDTMSHLNNRALDDDLDKKMFGDALSNNMSSTVQMWMVKGQSEFFDDQRTPNKVEDRDDALVGALSDAVKWLTKTLGKDMSQWQWGKLHTIKWFHPMGFGPLSDLSIGPYPHPGGSNTVRNAEPMGFGKWKYMCLGGPVMRHIIDMSDPDHALIVIDGSESGQYLSPHYRDMHSLFYNSQYIYAEKRPEKIMADAESVLTLTP